MLFVANPQNPKELASHSKNRKDDEKRIPGIPLSQPVLSINRSNSLGFWPSLDHRGNSPRQQSQTPEHGFEELRSRKGSHRQFWNPTSKRAVTIAVHTKKEVGTGLLNRILKDAGIKESKG